jgi:hypothetical protein
MPSLLDVARQRWAALAHWVPTRAAAVRLVLLGVLAISQVGSTTLPGALGQGAGDQAVYLPLVVEPPPLTCADLDAAWGVDWPRVLEVLDALIADDQTCGPEPLLSKKYAAHYNYGVQLEQAGDVDAAVVQYQAAFAIDPHRREAWSALVRLGRLPPPTPVVCQPDDVPILPYNPPWEGAEPYVSVQGRQLVLNGSTWHVKGVNYYPRAAPWYEFLPEATLADMTTELDVIVAAGFNTLRVFLWYDALFTCSPEDAVPLAEPFEKVDALLGLAHARGLKVILTLNDLPDLTYRPLYTDWARYDAQTAFIVERYRDEPTILAWDLRNEGDIDYGALAPNSARFTQQQVIDWLAHISQLVNGLDSNHLTTAGWLGNPLPTSALVDFLSFHHWSGADYLRNRMIYYRSRSGQPLLVEEVGRHTYSSTPPDPQAEAVQLDFFQTVVGAAEAEQAAGWVVWTAFDFYPPPGQPANYQHFYGLWRTDLSPKPALSVLPLGR